MANRMLVTFMVVLCGLLLAGCGTKTGPVTSPAGEAGDSANPTAVREVTIRVEGMIERQNIT